MIPTYSTNTSEPSNYKIGTYLSYISGKIQGPYSTFMTQVTAVSLKFIFGNGISTGVKVFLQGVHLSAQDVPESFHFC